MSKLEVDAIEPQSGTTLTLGASGGSVNFASGTTITDFTSTGIDDNATSTAITIDSSENVGIGTASPDGKLQVSAGTNLNAKFIQLSMDNATNEGIGITFSRTSSDTPVSAIGITEVDEFTITSREEIKFFTGGGVNYASTSERMRIDPSGQVGINTTSPAATLDVNGGLNCGFLQSNSSIYATSGIFRSSDGSAAVPSMQPGVDNDTGFFRPASNVIGFSTAGTEQMRIDASGNVLIGKTSTSLSVAGSVIFASGNMELAKANNLLTVNRLTTDGTLIVMAQADVQEGSITVSGSTVSYNGFTGTHWSRFTDNSKPNILKGTVLESLDEMCDWYNLEFDVTTQNEEGNDVTNTKKIPHILDEGQSVGDIITYNHEGTDVQATIVKETDIKHVKSKISDTVDAKNVYGVFSAYDEDGEGYNDFYVASVGSFVVRIKQGETVAKGDLLQSNGDGTAKVQTDDNVKSSSFAKVLSTTVIETYEDGSFLVPCSLMC